MRNQELGIFGILDGVETRNGALVPVEIKAHAKVSKTDIIELAFYWLLLEPHRTKQQTPAEGVLFLKSEGQVKRIAVPLNEADFRRVKELISGVRSARTNGVAPTYCNCSTCRKLRSADNLRAARINKDLTAIDGIGTEYAAALKAVGIGSHDKLVNCDIEAVAAKLKRRRKKITEKHLERWRWHAQSYHLGAPIARERITEYGDSFIALDLEYGAGIWAIGAAVVVARKCECQVLWSENENEETHNLLQLADLVSANPEVPVITWSGTSADVPQLKHAAVRFNLGSRLDDILERHLDLYMLVKKKLRLPIPGFGLKDVAQYFEIPRSNDIGGGFEALMKYNEYISSANSSPNSDLKCMLIDYCRDDVVCLVEVAHRMRSLCDG